MENSDKNNRKVPYRMARLSWPKARYGVYLAFVIILFVLLILYKDFIL